MEQTPWIERYSWFGMLQHLERYPVADVVLGMMHDMVNVNPDNQMMGQDGGPNAKGQYYLTH